MWQCMPNQTEGVTAIKVWGTRILFKHFWYSQLNISTVVSPGQNTLVIYISILHHFKMAVFKMCPRPIKKTKTAALENATAADGRVCCWLLPPPSGNITAIPQTGRGKSSTEVSFCPEQEATSPYAGTGRACQQPFPAARSTPAPRTSSAGCWAARWTARASSLWRALCRCCSWGCPTGWCWFGGWGKVDRFYAEGQHSLLPRDLQTWDGKVFNAYIVMCKPNPP